jgi:CheY-like chemotaxis protein
VRCDPNQFENALLNLAINARDAIIPSSGRIRIETGNVTLHAPDTLAWDGAEPGDYVCITVSDTGCGMTPDVLAHAFEPFFTTKPDGQGTGLGLSQLYGFVRQSHGVVRLESQVSTGTSVHLYLPRHEELPDWEEKAAVTGSAQPQEEHGAAATVLLVEDEVTVRTAAAEALRQAGFTVVEAEDGPEGLNALLLHREEGPRLNLLVADIGLPGGLNGRQLADAARSMVSDLPVLLITGYADDALEGKGQLTEGMALLAKPFELAALTDRVQTLLNAAARA